MPALLGLELAEMEALALEYGQKAFRGKQLYQWLYQQKVSDFDSMGNLPKDFRQKLQENWQIGRRPPVSCAESTDGTKKYLFPVLQSGFIESAIIPDEQRITLCVSTQVGCKMGCVFCATAKQGFNGNLGTDEILNQYLSVPEQSGITNIVYMGMGEPLDNPQATFKSLRLLTDSQGINLSSRRITLSTIGIPGPLAEYLQSFSTHLAISIHSPFDAERKSLMPIQNVHPISDIITLLRSQVFSDQRRLSFEYIMFDGINDSPEHAKALANLVKGLQCRINLIHYHSVPGNALQGSPRPTMEAFQTILKDRGLMTTIRRSRGEDIQAACGLLSTKALLAKKQETPDF